jgi:hypothetical protein
MKKLLFLVSIVFANTAIFGFYVPDPAIVAEVIMLQEARADALEKLSVEDLRALVLMQPGYARGIIIFDVLADEIFKEAQHRNINFHSTLLKAQQLTWMSSYNEIVKNFESLEKMFIYRLVQQKISNAFLPRY